MKYVSLYILVLLPCFCAVTTVSAQSRYFRWREEVGDKYIGLNLSTTRYRGDLSDAINWNHWQLGWGAEVNARYRFDERWCYRIDIGVYHVRAEQRYSRNAQNVLNFFSTNPSANIGVQWDVRPIDYNLHNIVYVFAGLGITKIGAKTELGGVTYSLPEFKTEGIDYPLWVGQIHYGVGIPINIGSTTQLRFVGRYTHLFSDYLDDVSTVYADKSQASALEKALADKRIAENLSPPNVSGAKRGEPTNNDGYFMLTAQFIYKF